MMTYIKQNRASRPPYKDIEISRAEAEFLLGEDRLSELERECEKEDKRLVHSVLLEATPTLYGTCPLKVGIRL